MRIAVKGLFAGLLMLAMVALGAGAAQAQGPVLEDGKTKAVYDYTKAVKERVFIPQPGIDQDKNGQDDFVTADIIRPAESSTTNKMPAIIDPSPYYTTSCRGNETQCMADFDNDGVNDRWPLFYDNYFVPRGYAYVLAQMNGTAYTEHGCPNHGGPGDVAGEKSVVDWLNGRVKAYGLKAGTNTTPDLEKEVTAPWHNGSSAMIGKSYDGTLSNGVAATGVEGLKTIVPISAISAWYNYSRAGGIVSTQTNYPNFLDNAITTPNNTTRPGVFLPGRQTLCAPRRAEVADDANYDTGDGDVHGDVNTFWDVRDYTKSASKVKASVFATHGFQDDNVRMDEVGLWWDALKANNVKRKLWLLRAGHEDPFDSRRAVWVDTLHRWFDHELYGVANNIMNEPAVTVEDGIDTWGDYADWPLPGTQNVDVFLRGAADVSQPGTLGGMTGGAQDSLSFTGTNSSEATLLNQPTGSQANKRVFISRPLTKDVRLSGTASVDLSAVWAAACGTTTVGTAPNTRTFQRCPGVSVTIADLGAGTQVSRSDEGLTSNSANRTCWGVGAPGNVCEGKAVGDSCTVPTELATIEHACYMELTRPISNTNATTPWRVTRGVLDLQNRESLSFQAADMTPVTITDKYRVRFPALPIEHTFKAGHQIVVVVGGINTSMASVTTGRPNNVPTTLDTRVSKVTLPIVGGYAALASAQGTDAETVAPVLGNDVPADILVGTTDATGTTVTYTNPTATDNEDPNPLVTCDPASGSKFPVGTTTVTCVAKDANGNTSAPKTFTVVVRRDVPVEGGIGGTVPATLALSIAGPATFPAFVPAVANTYLASTTATVLSTAGDALLTVSDPSTVGTGHLVNGSFVLPEPLQVRARNAANTGTAFNNLGSSYNLLSYSAPVSNDTVTLEFSQRIKADDPLRTGTYSKALTYTLSTTTP